MVRKKTIQRFVSAFQTFTVTKDEKELIQTLKGLDRKNAKNQSYWFRFFDGDTGAYTPEKIENLLCHSTANNRNFILECIGIGVALNEIQVCFS